MSVRALAVSGLVAVSLLGVGGAVAAPPTDEAPADRIMPPGLHTTDKARALASRHARALRDLNTEIYHCLPWLEVVKESIGFFRPRLARGDQRYLSLRVYVEQEPSREFSNLAFTERATAMFSRYVGPLLRRMTQDPGVIRDETIDGFNPIIEWLKEAAGQGTRPVHETIAVFIDKRDAEDYLNGRADVAEIAKRARVQAWDGERPVGELQLAPWTDDFVARFRVKGYQPPAGVACAR